MILVLQQKYFVLGRLLKYRYSSRMIFACIYVISIPRCAMKAMRLIELAMTEIDAKALCKAGEKRLGTDDNNFMRIFSERSRVHLAAVISSYHGIWHASIIMVFESVLFSIVLDSTKEIFHLFTGCGERKHETCFNMLF
ncbi:hypothetical protein Dimus_027395 [Dionaea muscipula]